MYELSCTIHCYIRESICLFIILSIHMSICYKSSPVPYHTMNIWDKCFEMWCLDLIATWKLFDKKLTISSEFYLRSSEFDCSSYTQRCCSVFCDIIRRMSDIFMSSLERSAMGIHDINTTTSRSGISSSSTITIHYYFHSICFYILERDFFESEKLWSQIIYEWKGSFFYIFPVHTIRKS